MVRMLAMIMPFVMALVAMGCAQPETDQPESEAPPPEATAMKQAGPDPTEVDPDHYKAEFENERVRVLRIAYGPGEKSVMHYHPDSVGIFLTDHHVRFETPDGSTEEVHLEAGQHRFLPAGQHLPQHIGEEPWELILVELKEHEAAPAEGETGPDPTVVDADHYKAEFENERVRVLRITYDAGEQSVMHYHPDSVAVFLTPHHVKFGKPDGTAEEAQIEAGRHQFTPAEQHLPQNVGDAPLELLLVELK